MDFPVHFELLGLRLHAHSALELLAYIAGVQLYLFRRRRVKLQSLTLEQNLWIITACVIGAAAGSKLLAWFESPMLFWHNLNQPHVWFGGKTIVGGLLGGWVGVEIAKSRLGVTQSTGDRFVFPIILGLCIGRVGCFLTGLEDRTHGVATNLPWAIDFGDGIARHPTQLYEIGFLILLAAVLAIRAHRHRSGELFRLFMLAYLLWRFGIEFIKPRETPYAGLSAIQWASLFAAGVCMWQLYLMRRTAPHAPSPAVAEAPA
jgi:phosphatidylglycerol---prolipoprotein diacylglyceryl transferase